MARTETQQARSQQPEQQNRLMVAGVTMLGVAAIVALAVLGGQSSFEPTPAPEQAAAHAAHAGPNAPQVSFVRIDAGGNAVISGEARPGATITLRSYGAALGSVTADAGGAFSFVTSKPLAPGNQEITLSSQLHGGAEQAPAHGITVNVPATPSEGALALLAGKGLATSSLFGGDRRNPAEKGAPLTIGSVDYSGTGSARIAGTAPPDSKVELLLGATPLGHTLAGANGHWQMRLRSVPQLSGEFHLKAFHSGSASAG